MRVNSRLVSDNKLRINNMKQIKNAILWVSGITMCVTGMMIPSQDASFFNEWYLAFFISLIVYMVIMISNEKE